MGSINLTQKELQEILENFYKKGNEENGMKTKDFLKEMIQYIQTITTNAVNTK
ncbi:hypothetical protein [Bacillus sp. EAC]|uniref:hypothetical protein n=1 Tax=Bacillus sp. EAC TaxID=1978338 RepID=UPI0015C4EA0C|nr:hypothetical protein [Bacillus sp. EAC]